MSLTSLLFKAARLSATGRATMGRFLLAGDIASVAACIALAILGLPIMLIIACLPAVAAYMMINEGAWSEGKRR